MRKLPSLGLDGFGELAIFARGNTIEVVANILRELKGSRVALVERVEERRKKTASRLLRLLDRDRTFCDANEAVPRLIQLARLLSDGRIQACEVECTIASVAAKEQAAAATRRAEVVVFGTLECVSDIVLHQSHARDDTRGMDSAAAVNAYVLGC